MNKPASELIALDKAGLDAAVRECARITAPEITDEEYEKIVAEDSLRYRNTRLDMERTILAYLSAAGSERAGVDALREALRPFAKMAGAMYVSGHCGGASPEDWPDRWHVTVQGGKHFHTPQQHGGYLTVADFRRAAEALATPPAQPAPDATHGKPDGAVRPLRDNAAFQNTDGADASMVLAAVRHCASSWEGEARLLGNVRAKDIVRAIDALVRPDETEALRLLAAEDERQSKLHDLLETIREQIRLEVPVEHRPAGLFKNIQDAVYTMRGRTPLMNDAAVTAALLSPKIAAAETSPGDVLAMKEALDLLQLEQRGRAQAFRLLDQARSVSDPATLAKADAYEECGNELKAVIDRLDVKAEAKSQEPEAVACQWRLRGGTFPPNEDPWSYVDYHTGLLIKKHPEKYETRWLYTHPTTKPEAPAVSVDAIVCPAKFAFGMNDPQATTFRYATNTCRSASSDLHRTPAHEWRQQKMSAFRNIVLICDCPSCMVLGLSCRTAGR